MTSIRSPRSLGVPVALLSLLGVAACSSSSTSWTVGGIRSDQERYDRSIEQPLLLEPGESVDLGTPFGAVDVRVAEAGFGITAEVTGYGDTVEEARELAQAVELELQRDGSTLRVRLVRADGAGLEQVRVGLRVAVPAGTGVTAHSGAGGLQLSGALGDVHVESGFGEVRITGARGRVQVHAGSGAITVGDVAGPVLEVESMFGAVRVDGSEAQTCTLHTSSGQITLREVTAASFALDSGFGAISMSDCRGSLKAETTTGAITVDRHRAPRIELHSGFGGIRAAGVFGEVEIDSSSGAVALVAEDGSTMAGPWRLQSGFGAVQATVPGDLAAEVELKSGFGAVQSGLPLVLSSGSIDGRSDAARGALNGGGGKLTMRTTSGAVSLRGR